MPSLLASLARTLTTHWVRALVVLIASLIVLGILAGTGGKAADDFSIPGAESQKAYDLLEQRFPAAAGDSTSIVVHARSGALQKSALTEFARSLGTGKRIAGVSEPQVSTDGRTAVLDVQHTVLGPDLVKADGTQLLDRGEAYQRDHPGEVVEMRGPAIDVAGEQSAPVGELLGIAVAIILLTILFRSGSAMVVTLVAAITGLAVGQMLLAVVSKPLGLPDFAAQIAIMLGLGAGIDYALLIVGRYREEVASGREPPEAAAQAAKTAGTSVVAAGAIVMVAIAGLLVVGIPLIGKMGLGAAIAVAMVVVSSLTVLPIMFGALKRFLRPKDAAHADRSERFGRWGERIVRRPWMWLGIGTIVLILLAIPATDLRLGQPDDGNQPTSMTQRRAYDLQSAAFGAGSNGPLLLVVDSANGKPLQEQALARLTGELKQTKGVVAVMPPRLNDARDTAVLTLIPSSAPQDAATADLVNDLRDTALPPIEKETGARIYVGGQTASFLDFSDAISRGLPVFILVVCGLSIVLLMAVFRSVLVPLASAVFNLLSIAAAYGVMVAVFQWGWGASLIGAADNVPVASFVPMFMFAILFGLSMDYNVFLLSRIHEAYLEGDTPNESVIHGLSRIAKVILVAGLIMASVFLAFVTGSEVFIKMFGIGLGAAILIDVLVIRMLVSPALMVLLGRRAWWMPGWLGRILPNISLEGH